MVKLDIFRMHTETQSEEMHSKSSKVLIFEEDSAIRALIVQGLKSSRKVRVYEAGSWGGVDQKTRTQRFDLIVLGQLPVSKVGALSLEVDLQRERSAHQPDKHLEVAATALSTLLESCERLVLLYQNEPATDGESAGLSHSQWSAIISLSAQQLHLSSAEKYQLYPRPARPSLINSLTNLGCQVSEARPNEQQMTSTEHAIADQNLVLWAGPDDHPIVSELQRACASMHHHLVSVDSAQYALRETRRTRFEACFVHNELSDMPGLSLVRSLRREVGESLPVAYAGVAQQVGDRLEGVHAGVSLYHQ